MIVKPLPVQPFRPYTVTIQTAEEHQAIHQALVWAHDKIAPASNGSIAFELADRMQAAQDPDA